MERQFIVSEHTIQDCDLTIARTNDLQTTLNNKVDDSQVLPNGPSNGVFTDTVYTHPSQH